MKSRSRRQFIKDSLAVGAIAGSSLASPDVSASSASSYGRIVGANDRIRVGLIGCGGQGRADLGKMIRVKNVECTALCDVDDEQTAKAAKVVEDASAPKPGVTARDFRRLLDMKDLDAVIVGTPDHWHALPTVMACMAGKDVYVEKPLAVSIGEGRVMVRAARR